MKPSIRKSINPFIITLLIVSYAGICASPSVSPLTNFPIQGEASEWGLYYPLPYDRRIIYSIIAFAYIAGILATLPLYLSKCFENSSFYELYIAFWLLGTVILQVLLSMLTGMTPAVMPLKLAILRYAFFSAIILELTILPAYLQHKNKPD